MNKVKEHILVASLLLVILIILFNKVIIGGYVFASGDTLSPQAFKQAIANIKSEYNYYGYWFPYIFSGMPTLHSFIGASDSYLPQKLIMFLHQLGMPWIWNFIIHYIFGGFGMYLLLRYLKQNKYSSFFGSSLFMISPYMVAYFVHGHGSQMMTSAYIPWIILYLFKIFKETNLINFSLLAILIGLQLQRGHIQIAYYTWLLIGLYIIIKIIIMFKNKIAFNYSEILKKYFFIFSSLLLGVVLSLNVYLPVFSYTSNSTRGVSSGGMGLELATAWSLNFYEFITLIIPYFFGFGGTTYCGYFQFTDFANYIGLIILLLAVIGFYKSEIKLEHKLFFFFSIIFSLLLASGKHAMFIYELFYNYLPFFDKFRAPVYFLIIFYFSILCLASIGLSNLIQLLKEKKSFNIFLSIFLLIIVFLFSMKKYDYESHYIYKLTGNDNIDFTKLKNTILTLTESKFDLNADRYINSEDNAIINSSLNKNLKILYLYSSIIKDSNNDGRINTSDIDVSDLNISITSANNRFDHFIFPINNDLNNQIFIIIILIVAIILYYKTSFVKRRYIYIIFIVVLLYDYYRINIDIISPTLHTPHNKVLKDKSYLINYLSEDPLIEYIKNDSSQFRILDLTGSNANRWAAFNIENIHGYHPAKLSTYNTFLESMQMNYNYLNLLNVKYLISDEPLLDNSKELEMKYYNSRKPNGGSCSDPKRTNQTDCEIVLDGTPIIYSGETWTEHWKSKVVFINEVENINPRLFYVEKINFYNSDSTNIYDYFTKLGFDSKKISFVDTSSLNKKTINDLKNISYNPNSIVEIINWSPDIIKLNVKTNSSQFLFLSEIFYPGWEVNIDVEIIKTNGLFRGIIIPAGEREILLEYKPKEVIIGKWIYIISLICVLLLLIIGVKKRQNV